MPPSAMCCKEVSTISSSGVVTFAPISPRKRCWWTRSRNSSAMVLGDLGALPKPPGAGSKSAARLRHCLHGLHIDIVNVRAFLAVNLDRDEMLVHQVGDLLVLKGLALHHVAPVAGGVADAEQDGFVFTLRLFQRLLAPRVRIYRVVRVLQQVGTRLIDEPVGVLVLFLGVYVVRHL